MSHHKLTNITVQVVLLFSFFLGGITRGSIVHAFENPPAIAIEEIIEVSKYSQSSYRIKEKATTDGFLATYTLSSDVGDFTATGPEMLPLRITEIIALQELTRMTENNEAIKGAKDKAMEKGGSIKSFFQNPEESIKGIPQGVGRFFQRTARKTKTAFLTLGDIHDANRGKSTTPKGGPGSQLPGKMKDGVQNNSYQAVSIGEAIAKLSGQALVNVLGYSDARRRIAKRLSIDPYTTNKPLEEKLDEVAWAAFSGGLGVDIVVSMIPGGRLASTTSIISNWVYDLPPGDLQVRIEKNLAQMGIRGDWIDLFLRHKSYSLTLRIALVEDLRRLKNVPDVQYQQILHLALTVMTEEQARFLINSLNMLANYNEKVERLASVNVLGTVTAVTQKGSLILPAPVDYLSWTTEMKNFKNREDAKKYTKKHILMSGKHTGLAAEQLRALGWKVEHRPDILQVPFSDLGSY